MLLGPSATITPQDNILLREQLKIGTGQVEDHTTEPTFKGRFIASLPECFNKELLNQVYLESKKPKSINDPNRNFFKEMCFHPIFHNGSTFKGCEYVNLLGGTQPCDSGTELRAPLVKFDRFCKLANKDEVRIRLAKANATEAMAIFTCSILERMATLGGWSDQSVPMTARILRYTLNSGNPKIVGLPWATDPTRLSMTAVISPCEQEDGEYSGGDLLFAEKAPETSPAEKYLPETIKRYPYPKHGCHIVDSVFSMDTAGDMRLVKGEECHRIVVVVSAHPSKEQFISFLGKNSDKNLVDKDSPDIS
ncbi:hypothetical protein [Endozoicomonas sp. YOMI1]|uniref:hypothetical protein n=1 Tax=Endozoicomonas sp. YOMI1 TaxID=2828739 RepID=UPI0021482658|nr:hypothetical protein [Endozoicomonas sp. YOMI1]